MIFVEQRVRITRHFRNRNLTSESPHISTRRAETHDEAIGTLCAKCATKEVLKKVTQSTKSVRNQHIKILTYQYQYVHRRGGHCGAYGGSRSTVAFLNNDLSVLEVTLIVRR